MTDADLIATPCHCALLRKATRHVSQVYDNALASTGLKTTQFTVLSTLDRTFRSPPTLQELAKALVMDRSTLGRNLRPLERAGLIRLEQNPRDSRSLLLHLTSQGQSKLEESRTLWRTVQKRFEKAFGPSKTEDLRAALLLLATTPI